MKAAQAKKEKEAAKKVLKRERKQFRTLCKTHNYFVEKSGGEGEVVAGRLEDLEALCESLSLEQLQGLNERLRGGSEEEGRTAVEEAVSNCMLLTHAVSVLGVRGPTAAGEETERRGRADCPG